MPEYDGWDDLRLCSVCGDVETQGDVCSRCREQEMIDISTPPGIIWPCLHCGTIVNMRPGDELCQDCYEAQFS